MTATRRTNLFRFRAVGNATIPILSVGLRDLSRSPIHAFGEIHDDYRVVGNGTFKPSFGEGMAQLIFPDSGTYSAYFCMDVSSESQIRDHLPAVGPYLDKLSTTVALPDCI